ncbi:hypothetical protein [Burkholderia sp. Nafp2/4-1b]|uniref:hypothetical protein n=1 Tax=Burkholderia sp. Nafp2/4-1b TaxID=2116686 RepID=UPI0013CE742B|nr:hypothetical protein [Burkholderia sp. Nafp2/4-1b]
MEADHRRADIRARHVGRPCCSRERINANQVWAWRRLHAQGLLTADAIPDAMLPVVNESSQPSMALEVPTATDNIPSGSIQIQHGKTSIRIEGAPDPDVLRSVLDRILR